MTVGERMLEWVAWRFIWATHWTGWHQTYRATDEAAAKGYVWCADCLMWKRERKRR